MADVDIFSLFTYAPVLPNTFKGRKIVMDLLSTGSSVHALPVHHEWRRKSY